MIKTRLQTQSSAQPLFAPSEHLPSSSSSAGNKASSATCCQQTFFLGNERQDELKCKFDPRKSPSSTSTISNPQTEISSSRTHHQPRSTVSHLSPLRPSHFAAYEHTTSFASNPASAQALNFPASACAFPDRTVAAKQLTSGDHRLTGLWDGVVKVNRAEGPRGLWRGLSPTL